MNKNFFEKFPEEEPENGVPLGEPHEDEILTEYEKDRFFERLGHVTRRTGGYTGNLDQMKTFFHEVPSIDASDIIPVGQKLSAPQEHEIGMLTDRIQNAGVNSVVIEAGHAYMYQDLDSPGFQENLISQCLHATELTAQLEKRDIDVYQIIFIDDYNPHPESKQRSETLDLERLIGLVNSAGYKPKTLMYESSMEDLATSMMRYMGAHQKLLKTDGKSDTDENSRILLSRRNIELYRAEDDMVSCAMLDAALTITKLSYFGEGVVNVLPGNSGNGQGSYGTQQQKMRKIVGEHLGANVLPVFNLFTGDQPTDTIAAGAHHALRKPR